MIHSAQFTAQPAVKFVLFYLILKIWAYERTDMCTDKRNTSEYNDHYRLWLWVGLVGQFMDNDFLVKLLVEYGIVIIFLCYIN